MLAARVCRVEVRLNDQSQTAANHAVAVATAERCLHPADALVRHALHEADIEADPVHHKRLGASVSG